MEHVMRMHNKLKRVSVIVLKIYAVLCTLTMSALLAYLGWANFFPGTSVEEQATAIHMQMPIKQDFNFELSYHALPAGNRLPLQQISLFGEAQTNIGLELVLEPRWSNR
jgi:TRAP-type C4-dicarboxylate transport system permease small subunit